MRKIVPFVTAAVVLLAGCASRDASDDEHLGTGHEAIIKGSTSTSDQDQVVLIALDYQGQTVPNCSGSLIARNLVMTARHCVGELNADETVVTNYTNPGVLHVYTGADAPKKLAKGTAPAANGKKIVSAAGTALYPDVAFIVLDAEIPTIPIAAIRLTGGVTVGESLTIVGFGLTENNALPSTRMQRTNISVTDVYTVDTAASSGIDPGEFVFGEAACSGDSGGPALDAKTKAVVGVASRVGNGTQPSQTNPSAFCIGSATTDIYTSLAPTQIGDLVTKAFAAAGAKPTLEGQSAPEAPATDPSADPGTDEAPADQTPAPTKRTIPQVSNGGCSAAPHDRSGGVLGFVLAALGLALLRRRR
jgi:MYXO-CTERM domain-containing protein